MSEAMKRYRAKNKDKIREYNRKYSSENREKMREHSRKSHKKYMEKLKLFRDLIYKIFSLNLNEEYELWSPTKQEKMKIRRVQ